MLRNNLRKIWISVENTPRKHFSLEMMDIGVEEMLLAYVGLGGERNKNILEESHAFLLSSFLAPPPLTSMQRTQAGYTERRHTKREGRKTL